MSVKDGKTQEAPECIHDDMEQYYLEPSLSTETFAPGLEDLAGPQMNESTPWRRSTGWVADLAMRRPQAPAQVSQDPISPESLNRPKHVDAAAQLDEAEKKELEPVALDQIRLLVVHSNLETRKQVALMLSQLEVQVVTCGQAEQAILQVLHERPDAVIAEVGDNDLDALSLCRSLRDRVPEIPVLLVAAGHDEANHSLAMEAGAAEYLRRPITPSFVAERLQQAIQRSRAGLARHTEQRSMPTLQRELRRQELKVQSLFELSKNVVGCVDLDELYQGFLLNTMGQLGLTAGVLYHLDSTTMRRPIEIIGRGISTSHARRLLDFRIGLGAFLLQAPQPMLLDPALFPDEMSNELGILQAEGFGVACPIAAKGSPVGIALFGHKASGVRFDADDLVMLTAICNFAGPALEGARLYSELHLTYLSTVRAFVSSLEAKDTYTRGHSERVADYSRIIGESMKLEKHELDMLVFGAVLHDVGKIGVSEGILNKPGPLTPEEWRVVRMHPEMGARIVSNIGYLEPAVGHILHHHERMDGRGYPHGLVGSDIGRGARIVTVADSFDAMTTNRPYRESMKPETAIQLLRDNAGQQFDPEIVERFIDLMEDGSIKVPK